VSPEFKPSDATAEEKGSAIKMAVASRLFDFMFKARPLFKLVNIEFII
jgi:hypothetical protein